MREKLLTLLKNEGLTPGKLAELLGVQPSGISHIMSGRNKPSFDLVQKILRRFPKINPDWLLLDSTEMYRPSESQNIQPAENAVFSAASSNDPINGQNNEQETLEANSSSNTSGRIKDDILNISHSNVRRGNIKRIIVLYDDRSFESYEVER